MPKFAFFAPEGKPAPDNLPRTRRSNMRFFLIANPAAGRGKARKHVHSFIRELRKAGAKAILKWTEAPGHARELATMERNVDAVIAIGGDGTVHEVAGGLIDAGFSVPMGVVPFGSGNDFARMLALPDRPSAIAQVIANMQVRAIDYGSVQWEGEAARGSDVFVNALGCGFDAFVAADVSRRRRAGGRARYLPAVMRSLTKWSSPRVNVRLEADTGVTEWSDDLLLCTAANGTSTGGGIRLTPRASPVDGLFDVCIAPRMTAGRILRVLPKAVLGRHLDMPEVTYLQTNQLTITSTSSLPLHLDGEVVPVPVNRIEARIVPGGLRVLTAYQPENRDPLVNR